MIDVLANTLRHGALYLWRPRRCFLCRGVRPQAWMGRGRFAGGEVWTCKAHLRAFREVNDEIARLNREREG